MSRTDLPLRMIPRRKPGPLVALGARPGLPVILSSGYTAESLGDAENAPWPLLRKPYTLEQLADAIAEAAQEPPASKAPAA